MKRKKAAAKAPVADPAFAEIDAMVERADAEFKAILKMVKPAYRARYLAIVEHTDAFCINHLQPLHRDYELYCHVMAAALCGKGSPVVEGKAGPEGWAAAIVAALGFVNFLSDSSFPPVKTMAEVAAGFGVSESGLHAKSRQIRRLLDLSQFDPQWTLPSLMMRNPMVWMLETTSGLIVDIRRRPRAEQVSAFEAGLIPFVPADVETGDDSSSDIAGSAADAMLASPNRDTMPTVNAPSLFEVEPKDVVSRIGGERTREGI
jgi:hypothetical protein